jgi:DNA-binding transcriptional regulator YbjK
MSGPVRTGAPAVALSDRGQRRRLEILHAALRVMARDGLRAVSHRAVATEAGVPLAATTYYFSDLEDLVTEAFLHWSEAQLRVVGTFHAAALDVVQRTGEPRPAQAGIVEALADAASDYVVDQVRNHRPDRVLEFAFLHEAARLPRLRAAVHERHTQDRHFLEQFHAAAGSPDPALDAQISFSLLLGLEKAALLADPEALDRDSVRDVLVHYLRNALSSGRPG